MGLDNAPDLEQHVRSQYGPGRDCRSYLRGSSQLCGSVRKPDSLNSSILEDDGRLIALGC
jgi:hypothetical protein